MLDVVPSPPPPATMGRSLMGLVEGPTTKTWDISCSSSSFWPAVLFKLLARTLPRIKLTSLVDKARPPEENTKGRLRKGAHHSQAVHAKQKRCAENVHLQTSWLGTTCLQERIFKISKYIIFDMWLGTVCCGTIRVR